MRAETFRLTFSLAAALVAAGCNHGGGGGGGSSSSSAAVTSNGTAAATSSAARGQTIWRGQDYTGTWTVQGTDPANGAYSGTAVVAAVPGSSGFTVKRLVTFAKKLPDGRDLLEAWNATATKTSSGLQVSASLKVADAYKRVGTLKRTAADMQPRLLAAALAGQGGQAPSNIPPGTTLTGVFSNGPTETWTFSTNAAPLFPETNSTHVPVHAIDPTVRSTLLSVYAAYDALPDEAPFASRPEFQAAQHFARVDRTAKEFYRQRGPTAVVVLDKVTDAISIAEETHRADAFSRKLFEKAKLHDADLKNQNVQPCGMISYVDPATGARYVSGDEALYQGVWVESQAFRYLATNDPEALANVVLGTKALVTLVDVTPTKDQFARAIQDTTTPAPGWVQGTGAFANLAWLPGGNNDMLHGIDTGFFAAEMVLPQGHALRAEIGRAAVSLLNGVGIAQSGTHEIFLSYVAWKTTNDPALLAHYQSALGNLTNFARQQWIAAGDGIVQEQGITDWSGHHLGLVDMIDLTLLGGATPTASEQPWRAAGASGAKAAFANLMNARLGLLSCAAAAQGAPGASDLAKEILAEIPYPKPTGDVEIDLRVSADFCMSPYPSAPWKLDWMTNTGREQAIEGRAIFHRGSMDNYWNSCPMEFGGGASSVRAPGQDYLHAYWYARFTKQLGPND